MDANINKDHEFDVVVVGSCISDFISYVPYLPRTGETVKGHRFESGFGGKGANQCVQAAKLGCKTAMVGKLGVDLWGDNYKKHLAALKVNTDYLKSCEGTVTGIAQINVSDNGDNQIVIAAGANNEFNVDDITEARSLIDNAKVLVCQLEIPCRTTFSAMRGFKGISILNAAPAPEENTLEMYTLPTILCVNEREAASITRRRVPNIDEAKRAISNILCLGCRTVIITMGRNGAVFASADNPRTIHVKSPQDVRAIDTTGAGDSFIGALAHYLSTTDSEIPLVQKVGAACMIASMSVTKRGTQSSYVSNTDLDNFNIATHTFDWKYLD